MARAAHSIDEEETVMPTVVGSASLELARLMRLDEDEERTVSVSGIREVLPTYVLDEDDYAVEVESTEPPAEMGAVDVQSLIRSALASAECGGGFPSATIPIDIEPARAPLVTLVMAAPAPVAKKTSAWRAAAWLASDLIVLAGLAYAIVRWAGD
jgi:hypothetical protein